jgi:hypothetical protein
VGRTRHAARLDEDSDTVRVVFHGRPLLQLDRDRSDSGAVDTSLDGALDLRPGLARERSFGGRVLPEQSLMARAAESRPR